jgi:uncharacterized membrane protein
MRARGNIAVLGIPTAISLAFLYSFALTYITAEPGQFGIYEQRRDWLYVHVLAGMAALLLGPVQLWLGLNKRTAILHRVLGGLYVAGVFASAIAAFYLAFHSDFGWVFAVGLTGMASTWVVSTSFATIAICLRQVEQHREWMIRSYVLTSGFILFRLIESGLEIARVGTIVERMTAASWLAWSVPLLIVESILQGRKIFKRTIPIAAQPQNPVQAAVPSQMLPFEPRAHSAGQSRIADDAATGWAVGKK